jgi:hypothetical protein
MQKDQTVSEMVEEVLERQAKALAHRSGHSLEDASRAVSDTEAGRRLRDLANGAHRHEKAQEWQGSVFWERAEERLMHLFCSEVLSRFAADFAAEGPYSWLEGTWSGWKARRSARGTMRSSRRNSPARGGDTLRRRASGASSEARKGRTQRAPSSCTCCVGMSRPRDFGEPP